MHLLKIPFRFYLKLNFIRDRRADFCFLCRLTCNFHPVEKIPWRLKDSTPQSSERRAVTGLLWSHAPLSLTFPYSVATLLISRSLLPSHSLRVSWLLCCRRGVLWSVSRGCEEGGKLVLASACSPLSPLRLTLPPRLRNLPSYSSFHLVASRLDCLLQQHVFPGRFRVSRCDSSSSPLSLYLFSFSVLFSECEENTALNGVVTMWLLISLIPFKAWLIFQTRGSVCFFQPHLSDCLQENLCSLLYGSEHRCRSTWCFV